MACFLTLIQLRKTEDIVVEDNVVVTRYSIVVSSPDTCHPSRRHRLKSSPKEKRRDAIAESHEEQNYETISFFYRNFDKENLNLITSSETGDLKMYPIFHHV